MNMEKIVSAYESEEGIRAASRKLDVSEVKIRKVLITMGVYETERTREIAKLWDQGLRYAEIAEVLGVSKSCVYANTPYEKGMYLGDNPTKNAIRVRRCKEKKKREQAEK